MGVWIPNRHPLALKMRKPALLVPGRKPVCGVTPVSRHLLSELFGSPVLSAADAWRTSGVVVGGSGVLGVRRDGYTNSAADGYLQVGIDNPGTYLFDKTLIFQYRVNSTIASFWKRLLLGRSVYTTEAVLAIAKSATLFAVKVYARAEQTFTVPSGVMTAAGQVCTVAFVGHREGASEKSPASYYIHATGPAGTHFAAIHEAETWGINLDSYLRVCEDAYATTPPDVTARALVILDRAVSATEAPGLFADLYRLYKPAANEPIFIGTAGGGGAFTLTADPATYTLSGQTAGLTAARKAAADSAAYTYSGQAATLSVGRAVAAGAASYAYTGNDVGLTATRTVVAASVAYTYTGQDATLTYTPAAKILTAEATAYTYTPTAAGLSVGRVVAAATTAYSYSGQAATLFATRTLTADSVAYSYTGQDANLIYTAVGAFTLTADPASFLLSGQDVVLTAARTLPAVAVAYSWTGQDAGLSTGLGLVADSGAYIYTPADATFSRTYVASAETASYILAGLDVTFTYSGTPVWIEVSPATGVWSEIPSAGGTWTEI